ncbi:hypothetical protein CON94_09135 [Bacillus pseudomycoides]|uniref:conjugal transfer protein n=1 Tax=Bacillus pseudomycoides TaxID=64104 RepID=UPI000BEB94E9|nr:conjugal transfer protein [Bacillus pseudomycoides]PEF75667.1 hypothetical protein CON94_09135 [Bacillus pseudomycoides]
MKVFDRFRSVKEKSAEIIEEHKPHRLPKEKRTLPIVKKTGFWKVIIWTIILCAGTSGTLALLRAQTALGKSKHAESAIEKLQVNAATKKQDAYTSPKIEIYASKFVDTYMNVPKEKKEKRQEELAKLYAKGLKVDELKDFAGYRKLKGKTLYDVQYTKDYAVLQYKVVYENVKIEKAEEPQPHTDQTQPPPPPKTAEKENKSERTAILNVPIAAKDGKYAVVENPYTTSADQLQSDRIDAVQNPLVKKEQITFVKKEKIEKWLKEFFTKYADSKQEDMTYMMKEPKALNGMKKFVALEDVKVYETSQEDVYTVKTNVLFKETDIDLENKEVYTLKLKLKEGKYFIEKMEYTLGGNE